jgi:hypothetical protein
MPVYIARRLMPILIARFLRRRSRRRRAADAARGVVETARKTPRRKKVAGAVAGAAATAIAAAIARRNRTSAYDYTGGPPNQGATGDDIKVAEPDAEVSAA